MSRIGKKLIELPSDVKISLNDKVLSAKGTKGELSVNIPEGINCVIEGSVVTFSRDNDSKSLRALHGLTRALANNIIQGVSTGYTITLKLEGVGYKVELRNERLQMNMGYSHPLLVIPPQGVSFQAPNPTTVLVSGIDKQLVGTVASKIRSIRPPEPYKGKGIRYEGEYVRRKAGKTSAK
ncbi:MAG: 50S ribosomal protein L6 [Candidatus Kapabacteria bacterium]|nr:50S ribosomal protein L6 [Candidatus Kapabacteria bacterium]